MADDKEKGEDVYYEDNVDGGWAWMVCLSCFIISFIIDGVIFSYGVIFLRLLREFDDGRSKTAWVGSSLVGVCMSMGPFVSILLDYYSCRQVIILGSFISSSGFILSVFAPNIETLIFTYGFLGGAGFGLAFLTSVLSVGLHFTKKRALATGIATSGSGLGTFILSYGTERLMAEYEWKGSVLLIAGLTLNCIVCGALVRPLTPRNTRILPCCPIKFKRSQSAVVSETSGQDKAVIIPLITVQNSEVDISRDSSYSDLWTPALMVKNREEQTLRLTRSIEHINPMNSTHRKYKSDHHIHNLHYRPTAKIHLDSPLNRKDVFYSGSLYNLPEYQMSENMDTFVKSMTTIVPGQVDTDNNESMTGLSAYKMLLCDRVYLMFLLIMVSSTGISTVYMYLPDLAVCTGMTNGKAALLVSTFGVTNIGGRLLAGWLAGHQSIDSVILYTVAMGTLSVFSAVLPFCSTFWMFISCSAIFGIATGTTVSLRTIVLADVLGISKLTKAFGLVAFVQGIAFTVGPPLSGALFDATQSFLPPYLLTAGVFAVGALTCALIRPVEKCKRVKS